MVKAGLDEYSEAHEPEEDHVYVWSANMRCNLGVWLNTTAGEIYGPEDVETTDGLDICKKKSSELCFVQFYEVVNEYDRTVNNVESILACSRPHWHQTWAKDEIPSTGKSYGLVPVDSLLGIVLVTKVYEYIDNFSISKSRRNEIGALSGPQGSWTSKICDMNHNYIYRSDMYD